MKKYLVAIGEGIFLSVMTGAGVLTAAGTIKMFVKNL